MTTQFIVGQEYKINAVESITVTRRSEVSVWFSRNGKEFRRKIQVSGYGNNQQEFINYEDRSLYAAKPQASITEVETIETTNAETIMTGWDYINSQASYDCFRNENYAIFSKLSTAAYNGEFEGIYFEKIYNWIDQMTATEIDTFVAEFKDLDSTKHYVVFAERALKLYQNRDIEPQTINPSDNAEPQAISTSEILETLDLDTTETISASPQDSTQELDRFEVVYQVADVDDEISYEATKVYAYNTDHAKSIVSQSLQSQHARYIITGCEYALVIDDLSAYSLVD